MKVNGPKVSAVVIAFNDEANIRPCLESLSWADEIIVVDSFSTDRTTMICQEFTDKIYQHEFQGFGRLRNEAMAHASYDWIFSLDTDERATSKVCDEIRRRLREGPGAKAYFVPRFNNFLGRWIKHCGWYPDYRQPQFYHKAHMLYRDDLVHESFEVNGPIGYFSSHVLQYPFQDIDHYFRKMDRYSSLMAEQMQKHGRRFRTHQLLSHPLFTFFKMYVMRRGFLDGYPGLILSGLYAYYTFVKYAKLWERDKEESLESHEREQAIG
ncbi:MAG: glycosyltransferase family 2 protein [Nitrospirales bacterium]